MANTRKNGAASSRREAILAAQDFRSKKLEIPEWGDGLFVRELDAVMVLQLFGKASPDISQDDATVMGLERLAQVACVCVVDAEGERIFEDDDQEALKAKPTRILKLIFEAAIELSDLGAEAQEAALGNSEPTRNALPS